MITLLKLKKLGVDLPSSLALLSPWADPSGSGESYNDDMADRDILLGPIMKNVWKNNDELYHFYIDEEDVDKQNELMFPLSGNYQNCPPIMTKKTVPISMRYVKNLYPFFKLGYRCSVILVGIC